MRKMLPCLLVVIILLTLYIPFYGCGSTPSFDAAKLVANTIAAMEAARSYSLNTTLTDNFTAIRDDKTVQMSDSYWWKGQRQVNIADQTMHMNMDIQVANGTHPITYTLNSFYFNDWYYTQGKSSAGSGSIPWVKTRPDKGLRVSWSGLSQMAPQLALLKGSSVNGTVKTGKFNGTEYFVLDLMPSSDTAADWIIMQNQIIGPAIAWHLSSPMESRDMYLRTFKSGSARFYITPDNYQIIKVSIHLLFDDEHLQSPYDFLGPPAAENGTDKRSDLTHVINDFKGEWKFSSYNQPVNIQLPQEALDAKENP